jgi:hypothetical protein
MKMRNYRHWSPKHLTTLRTKWVALAHLGTHKRATIIGLVLGRPRNNVYAKARALGLIGQAAASMAKWARQRRLVRLYRASMQG